MESGLVGAGFLFGEDRRFFFGRLRDKKNSETSPGRRIMNTTATSNSQQRSAGLRGTPDPAGLPPRAWRQAVARGRPHGSAGAGPLDLIVGRW